MTSKSPRAVWSPAESPPDADRLMQGGIEPLLARLLASRGIADADAARRFLDPRPDHLHDPLGIPGVEPAVELLAAAADSRESVSIVGDYDVDGVSSTALLAAVFKHCGIECQTILPHRMKEGYGFQPEHVKLAQSAGSRLIVTVDCGSSSFEAASAALELGLGLIVTDHHLPGRPLPEGVVEVNLQRSRGDYPFIDLCGAGLALKLATALLQRTERDVPIESLLRIACLGTICDQVPLVGENRVIAFLGLKALPTSPSPGLKALIRQAKVRLPLTASDVGYRLGPRINAAGRMAEADPALELLLTRDPIAARRLAAELEQRNQRRQEAEAQVVEEARSIFEARSPLPGILVAWQVGWHPGVVGIAAGRLAREFNRPTLLLSVEGNRASGSGRSIRGIDLHQLLSPWTDRLQRFGGHSQAIGLASSTDRLPQLRNEWENAVRELIPAALEKTIEYEIELPARGIDRGLLAELSRLEPFGPGNRQPLVKVGPLRVEGAPRVFGRGHMSLRAVDANGDEVGILGWNWAERLDSFTVPFEVLANLEYDSYRDETILRLVDSRPAG